MVKRKPNPGGTVTRLKTIVRPGAPWTRSVWARALRTAVGAALSRPKAVGSSAPSATAAASAKTTRMRGRSEGRAALDLSGAADAQTSTGTPLALNATSMLPRGAFE